MTAARWKTGMAAALVAGLALGACGTGEMGEDEALEGGRPDTVGSTDRPASAGGPTDSAPVLAPPDPADPPSRADPAAVGALGSLPEARRTRLDVK